MESRAAGPFARHGSSPSQLLVGLSWPWCGTTASRRCRSVSTSRFRTPARCLSHLPNFRCVDRQLGTWSWHTDIPFLDSLGKLNCAPFRQRRFHWRHRTKQPRQPSTVSRRDGAGWQAVGLRDLLPLDDEYKLELSHHEAVWSLSNLVKSHPSCHGTIFADWNSCCGRSERWLHLLLGRLAAELSQHNCLRYMLSELPRRSFAIDPILGHESGNWTFQFVDHPWAMVSSLLITVCILADVRQAGSL